MGTIPLPSLIRQMRGTEWNLVKSVFTEATLPYSQRILITCALGAGNRPFTIPTALASAVFTAPMSILPLPLQAVSTYLGSAVNAGYLINVGPAAMGDLSVTDPALLVHETTHVWQGRNSFFAATYVVQSAVSQCSSALRGAGTGGAYSYRTGQAWGSYNPEQQAEMVEDWYKSGMPTSGAIWPYIRDHVRRGDVG
jgi:hypothetical protein